jgi:hypothetical protein
MPGAAESGWCEVFFEALAGASRHVYQIVLI